MQKQGKKIFLNQRGSLQEISNDTEVRAVKFATPKNLSRVQ
jgi:hypothetical protein